MPSGRSSTNARAWAASRASLDGVVVERPGDVHVGADRVGEQERLLEDEAAHAGLHGDGAAARGQQAAHEGEQRGLAGAGGPDDGHRATLGDHEVEAVQHLAPVGERVRHAAEGDAGARRRDADGGGGAGRRRLGQDALDAGPARQRPRQVAEQEADQAQGPHQQREEVDEAGDVADRGGAGLHPVGAHHDQQDVGQVGYGVEQGLERGPHRRHDHLGLAQLGRLGLEATRLVALGAERLHHHQPVEALVDQLGDLADAVLGHAWPARRRGAGSRR